MRSDTVVVMGVRFQNPTQMHLAQDNHMIDALAPDRSDQPFGNAILPRRGWRGRLVPDAHGAKSACDNAPIDPIPIADEVVRSLTAPPLPHHRTYGSVYGGSRSYANAHRSGTGDRAI